MKNKNTFTKPCVLPLLMIVLNFALLPSVQGADEIILPAQGCPMAHCDRRMSDNIHIPPPVGNVDVVWQDVSQGAGSLSGLGCSSNGSIFACTFANDQNNLAVYDFYGNRLWSSGTLLNSHAYTSAPIVTADEDVIACDNKNLFRFGRDGLVKWKRALIMGGTPISPVLTANNTIILATKGGPIYAVNGSNGILLATLYIRKDPDDPGFFETINTPCVMANRFYVSTNYSIPDAAQKSNLGWLAAIDVDPDNPVRSERLKVAWHYEFGGPSGASPLLIGDTIYFDGDHGKDPAQTLLDPYIFAVQDLGANYSERFALPVASKILASFARDPRKGFWYFSAGTQWLVRREEITGQILSKIDVDTLVADSGVHVPSSAMSIAGDSSQPVMLIGAALKDATASGIPYVIAIDLVKKTLVWKVRIGDAATDRTAGQFPIVTNNGASRVVFTNRTKGAFAIGTK